MSQRSRATICVVVLFVLIGALILYIFSELFNESEIPEVKEKNESALKFKKEYVHISYIISNILTFNYIIIF